MNPLPLNSSQKALHEKAVDLCRRHRQVESLIIETLQEIDILQLYKRLGFSSLFQYAVGALGLSEALAYGFISVSRKAKNIASLQEAIKTQKLSVSKAARVVSVLNVENASRLIEFAREHRSRDIDFEVARIHPKAGGRDMAKPLSEDRMVIRFSAARRVYDKLKRVQALEAQRNRNAPDFEQAFEATLDLYLERNDPVRKAERAIKRQKQESLCSSRVPKQKPERRRIPLKAHEVHAVAKRDGGRCTHIDMDGKRCPNDRYLATHHVQLVSQGGSNDPENLTTLCWYHHDLVHQLVLPIDGGMNWLRSPYGKYGMEFLRLELG